MESRIVNLLLHDQRVQLLILISLKLWHYLLLCLLVCLVPPTIPLLLMLIRLILNPYYLITLPYHGLPLSDLRDDRLHFGPYRRLLAAELVVVVSRHHHILLTLDDPLIVLLFDLREVFVIIGAVSLRVGALAGEFILGVRKVLFFHQEIRVLGLAEGGG